MSLSHNNLEQLLTVEEVAAFYKVCAKTIRRKIVELEIPTVHIGRQIRIRATHVTLFAQKKW